MTKNQESRGPQVSGLACGWGTRITGHRFAVCPARWAGLPAVILVSTPQMPRPPVGGLSHVWLGD